MQILFKRCILGYIAQLQIIRILNLQYNVELTHGTLATAELLVYAAAFYLFNY